MGKKSVLVAGASSGIGKACAELLAEKGCFVMGTSRNKIPDANGVKMLILDVDNDDSVSSCVAEADKLSGGLDIVINCAGYGTAGSIEESTIEEAKAQFETNFFGIMRVCKAVLPGMRERGGGMIINITSLGAIVSAPFHGLYCASKFALEGLTESLRMEVARQGIKVVMVEPGDIKTGFTSARINAEKAGTLPVYKDLFTKAMVAMERNEQTGPDPIIVARAVEKIINMKSPAARYVAAAGIQKYVPLFKKLLPPALLEKEIMKEYGM